MPKTIRRIALASALAGATLLGPAAVLPAVLHQGAWAHSEAFAAGEPGDPKKAARVVEIVMDEGPGKMTYTPDRIETKKGEQIRFVLKNVGALKHEFVIDSFENNAKHKAAMEKTPNMHHDESATRRTWSQSRQPSWSGVSPRRAPSSSPA
jgi:uncharacterized cupredoxin-like copper-binding protein